MHALPAHHGISPADRLGASDVFAVLAHLIVILGVTFVHDDHPERRIMTLDVVLVPPSFETPPERADFLGAGEPATATATTSRGCGRRLRLRRPSAGCTGDDGGLARPCTASRQRRSNACTRKPTGCRPRTRSGLPGLPFVAGRCTSCRARHRPGRFRRAAAARLPRSAPRSSASSAPMPNGPRRKWISARTREHAFAAYMDAWRRKVERVGNLNYPERSGAAGPVRQPAPRGRPQPGRNRRGHRAPAFVGTARPRRRGDAHRGNLAAPFARFPESIANEVDVLHIQRTWIFHSGNRLTSP